MSAARGVFLEAGDFATGHCTECRREVLTYPDERPGEEGVRRCLHCDMHLAGELRWIDVADLGALGYAVDSGEDAAGGCATCANGCVVRTVTGRGGA
ncbi:MAG TPA: hypothetical protein VLF14_03400 [Candidatus Binatia bacterium]|nr:hypothetical protein [Candidatus Binatia bacterium]